MGKGDTRRPTQVDEETFAERWRRAFEGDDEEGVDERGYPTGKYVGTCKFCSKPFRSHFPDGSICRACAEGYL